MTLQRQQQKNCKFEDNLGSRPAWATEQDLVLIPQQSEAKVWNTHRYNKHALSNTFNKTRLSAYLPP